MNITTKYGPRTHTINIQTKLFILFNNKYIIVNNKTKTYIKRPTQKNNKFNKYFNIQFNVHYISLSILLIRNTI